MPRPFGWPVVGVGAVIWKDETVLLIRRGKPPRQGAWSLPGGHQEAGETVHEAVVREVREETGIGIRILDLVAVVDLIDHEDDQLSYHYTVIDMLAEWTDGDAVAGSDAAAVAWVPADRLADYDLPGVMLDVIAQAAAKRRG